MIYFLFYFNIKFVQYICSKAHDILVVTGSIDLSSVFCIQTTFGVHLDVLCSVE